jgi:para-aminobenzoate synthetase
LRAGGIRTLIIDNYDSFTFNLYQLIGQVNGEEPVVVRNDQFDWPELSALPFDNIVISPGPGAPDKDKDFGICLQVILHAKVPVLGVCLGHQGIGLAYGAALRYAPEPMHGRTSAVRHDGSLLYAGIPQGFQVVRYHSLMLAPSLPACLRAAAWTPDGILMGLTHKDLPRFGIQFHPESICTEYGDLLLRNFRDATPRSPRVFHPAQARQATVVPHPPLHRETPLSYKVYSRKIPFDTARISQAFQTLYGGEEYAFWLDSSRAEPGLSRFSFIGAAGGPLSAVATYDRHSDSVTVTRPGHSRTSCQNIYDYLSEELARRRCTSEELPFDFNCGFVGCFGYGAGDVAPSVISRRSEQPDAAFLFADRLIAFDHEDAAAWLVSYGEQNEAETWIAQTADLLYRLPAATEPPATGPPAFTPGDLTLRLERGRADYLDDIARCLQHIREGESYEICLTNQITATPVLNPLGLYLTLRRLNPAPYSAFLRFGELAVMSCSPERFLRLDRFSGVESRPIKGTRPRGRTPGEDNALRLDLRANEKDRSENLMIVDLLRNDLGLVCETGTVHVPALMQVETYETLHQLVSTVRGQLRPGIDAAGCVRAAFPGGSMTGAPKIRTMSLLDELEQRPRGIYSGSLGFLALNGTADLSIVIRALVSTPGKTTAGIGGAIVALSDPEAEFEETLAKARASVHGLIFHTQASADFSMVERALAALREQGCLTIRASTT